METGTEMETEMEMEMETGGEMLRNGTNYQNAVVFVRTHFTHV